VGQEPAPASGPDAEAATGRVLHRVVLPGPRDADVLPLYVHGDPAGDPSLPQGRRGYRVPAGARVSFGTYFNAFPASYWQRWTVLDAVTLRVTTTGAGTVEVWRSDAAGRAAAVTAAAVGPERAELALELPLDGFDDGGWYWLELVAGPAGLELLEAGFEAAPAAAGGGSGHRSRVTVAVTTMNRATMCSELLAGLAGDPALLPVLDQVLVVDQGSEPVESGAAFGAARAGLGERLVVHRQANLGGSGGFARGMLTALRRPTSDAVLLLDDDVRVEPEGILRAVAFADACRRPTVVGGHMFSMFEPTVLRTFGEAVARRRFFWGPAAGTPLDQDLATAPLAGTPWLHRRLDVEYNGWWMCLLPRQVLEQVGLALPLFIKWDDAEYGLRAGEAGVPTVSLPGAAVWHVPWSDKDDTLDWQAFFHARNRTVAALLHSPHRRGGLLVAESLALQLRHLLSMQYAAASLRLLGLHDVLTRGDRLHEDLATRLAEVRAERERFADARTRTEQDLPARRPAADGEPARPGRAAMLRAAAAGLARQLLPVRRRAELPPARLTTAQARWWVLARLDGAVVTGADGTGATWYRREPRTFWRLAVRSAVLHARLARSWPELAASYRRLLPGLTDPARWDVTFASSAGEAPAAGRCDARAPGTAG